MIVVVGGGGGGVVAPAMRSKSHEQQPDCDLAMMRFVIFGGV
jgi:hypothetical protein